MNILLSERLKSARVLNGLSLQELADKLDNIVTRQALHKYERGEVTPDNEKLGALAEVLNVNIDYFYREDKIELGELEFRKLNTLPAREESKIVERVKDHLSRYFEIERILAIDSTFQNPLKGFPTVKSIEHIEEAASEVRRAWSLGKGPIANCIELLEDQNIKVVEVEVEDGFDGMQTFAKNSIPVIALNKCKVKSPDRRRFTALHELAHLILPLGDVEEKTKETFCHQLAGAVLFPQDCAFKELGKSRSKLSIQELGALKKQYGISIQAIVMRARDLKIISDSYCKKFFFFLKQMDWKVNEPVEYIGEENSNRFNQLIFRALAEELISVAKAATLKNQSLQEFKENLHKVG